MLRYAAALFLGRVTRLGDIAILRARQASVAANRALPVQADGEIVGELPVMLAVADQPVLLIQPAG
jgi:diacylglycerol kinase family enzyme